MAVGMVAMAAAGMVQGEMNQTASGAEDIKNSQEAFEMASAVKKQNTEDAIARAGEKAADARANAMMRTARESAKLQDQTVL